MYASLVVIRSSVEKIWAEEYTDVAEACGVEFIRLEFDRSGVNGKGPFACRGFQGVEVSLAEDRSGVPIRTHEFTKDRAGNDCKAQRQLEFHRQKLSGKFIGVLPDTPYNRNRLAGGYKHPRPWKIVDPAVDAEIAAHAEAYVSKAGPTPTIDDENTILRKQVAEQAQALRIKDREILNERKRTTEILEAQIETGPTPSTVVEPEDVEAPYVPPTKTEEEIRDDMIEVVCSENSEWVVATRRKMKGGFTRSNAYREKIMAEVNKRLKARRADVGNSSKSGNDS